jgi:CBS domain-containing protein
MAAVASPAKVPLGDLISCVLSEKRTSTVTITPEATVLEALRRMAEREIGALPVMEGSELVGILTERDYARKVLLEGRSSRETYVWEIMTHPVVSVTPETTVDECMRVMTDERVRHLPVLERGGLVGIVSIGDLVNWIISSHERTIQQLQEYIAGGYPG